VEVGDAKTYIQGFTAGVKATNPNIVINSTWTGSFSDVALMTEAANTHIAAGADILTGSSQAVVGSIGAAQSKGNVLWFGTQADQQSLAPDLVVASQLYDWTGIVKEMIAKHKAGTLGGEAFTLDLANGGLKIVYGTGYTLPAEVKSAADAAIDGIKKNTIMPLP
jgi:basic membrane protein A